VRDFFFQEFSPLSSST